MILKTTNSGANWVNQASGTSQHLFSLFFNNESTGYATGDLGTIIKTTDGGTSWNPQVSGTTQALYTVFFVSLSSGYAAGEGGVILHSNDQPLPVELSYFNSAVKGNNVTLKWGTTWELNNSGFYIERRKTGGANGWKETGFVRGSGTVNEEKHYTFEDKMLQTGEYQYRLKQVDYNGAYEYHSLNSLIVISVPGEFHVSQNYPNPSNPKCKIDYELPIDSKVSIKLYNILGEEVYKIIDTQQKAGYYSTEFDGSNLASGVYFYKITTQGFSAVKKMVLVK
jgi:hypothetical protein